MKTIKTYSVILLAGAAAFASCDNSLQQDLSDAGVSVMADEQVKYENNVITINGRTYRISITDNLLEISYTSHGDIQLELTYKSVKLIYPAGSND